VAEQQVRGDSRDGPEGEELGQVRAHHYTGYREHQEQDVHVVANLARFPGGGDAMPGQRSQEDDQGGGEGGQRVAIDPDREVHPEALEALVACEAHGLVYPLVGDPVGRVLAKACPADQQGCGEHHQRGQNRDV